MKIPERTIQAQILQYLGCRGIKAFRINAGMVQTGEGRGKRMIRMAPKGFSDIMGVMISGRAIFVEVKAEGGKTTLMQEAFLEEMREQGALAFVAHSIDEVQEVLDSHNVP